MTNKTYPCSPTVSSVKQPKVFMGSIIWFQKRERDYEKSSSRIFWEPSSHSIPIKQLKQILKIPEVEMSIRTAKLEGRNSKDVTISIPNMYVMHKKESYMVDKIHIPDITKPQINCFWPSEPRDGGLDCEARSIVKTVVKIEKSTTYESSIVDEIMNLQEKVEQLKNVNLTNKETSLDLLKDEDALKEEYKNVKKHIDVRMKRDRDDKEDELEKMKRDFEWSIQKRQKKSAQ